jgi:hypothetical protein
VLAQLDSLFQCRDALALTQVNRLKFGQCAPFDDMDSTTGIGLMILMREHHLPIGNQTHINLDQICAK